jgi:hypothetical protein
MKRHHATLTATLFIFSFAQAFAQEFDLSQYFANPELARDYNRLYRNAFKIKSWENSHGPNCANFAGHWKVRSCTVNNKTVELERVHFDFFLKHFSPRKVSGKGDEVANIMAFKQNGCEALNVIFYGPNNSLGRDSDYIYRDKIAIAKKFQGIEALCDVPRKCQQQFEVKTTHSTFELKLTRKYKARWTNIPGLPIPGRIKGSRSYRDITIKHESSGSGRKQISIKKVIGEKRNKPGSILSVVKCLFESTEAPTGYRVWEQNTGTWHQI